MTKPRFARIGFFGDLVANRIRRRNVPLFLYWFVTSRCNFRCSYCYGGDLRAQGADLPTDVMLRLADELADAGARRVSLLGGEPLMREDLGGIVRRLADRRISVCLLTNGAFLADRIDDVAGIHDVGMSIDGREETHDAIRGRGAFRELNRAIEACRQRSIPVVLTYTLVPDNIGELDYVMDFVRRRGVSVTVNVAHGRIAGSGELQVSRATNEDYRQALDRIIAYQRQGFPVFRARRTLELMRGWPDYATDTADAPPAKGYPPCRFGSYGAVLNADGTLQPCFLNTRGGRGLKVQEHGFAKAWEHCQRMPHCSYCHVPCFLEYNAIFDLSLPVLANAFLKLSVYPRFRRPALGPGGQGPADPAA
jgi:MoaA/NifB/PqqE/SkfB family radical SAM enzyme